MKQFTTADLIQTVKLSAMIPTSQSTFTVPRMLDLAYKKLISSVVPSIISIREEFYAKQADTALVAGQNKYDIPKRAMGGILNDIVYIGSDNQERPMVGPIPISDIAEYSSNSEDTPLRYAFENGKIVLFSTNVQAIGSLRFKYFNRPNYMVETTSAAQITAISGADLTVPAVPTGWTVGTKLDSIRHETPFENVDEGLAISAINGLVITVSPAPASTLAVDNWLAKEGETPIPQCPIDWWPVLAQETVCSILQAQKDSAGLQTAVGELEQLRAAAINLTSPRTQGDSKIIVNRSSLLKGGWRRGFGRWR